MNKNIAFFAASAALLLVSGQSIAEQQAHIRLATTTSTYQSGLLDYLLPKFKDDSGYQVDVIAAGTGKALKMGENGDVDLVMTHAPEAEAEFVDKGYGVDPQPLMYNDFVLVGPVSDPAKISQQPNLSSALKQIASLHQIFLSRGDDSGTDKKEKTLWSQSQIEPNFAGYRSVGQGMGPTLNMASEMQGYTLTDRGTWLAYQAKLDLKIVYEGDPALFNPYQVILVSQQRYPGINYQGAKVFSDWLVSDKGQQLINAFHINGQQLFMANAKG